MTDFQAIGIDLGGTKIEAQLFDQNWSVSDSRRVATPTDYPALVTAVAELVDWADKIATAPLPVGIGAAGLVNPRTGLALTANLVATGKPFPADINRAVGRPVKYVNDCRALALSEAVFGIGQGHDMVLSLILGTGVGGGVAFRGQLLKGPTETWGEFGHTSAPAHLVVDHNLPVVRCGCGRMGCIETYISGPGLSRIANTVMGRDVTPQEIVGLRDTDPKARETWDIWCAFTADLLRNLTLTIDPDIIVLGGGLSEIVDTVDDLTTALQQAQLNGFGIPKIALAEGGATSGARGAAYAAVLAGGAE